MSSLEKEFEVIYKAIEEFRVFKRSEVIKVSCIDNFADTEIKLNNDTIDFIESQLLCRKIKEQVALVCIEEIKKDNEQFEIIKEKLSRISYRRARGNFTPMYNITIPIRRIDLVGRDIEVSVPSSIRSITFRICNFLKRA